MFTLTEWQSGSIGHGRWAVGVEKKGEKAEATGFAVRDGMFAQSVGVWKSNCASTL